MVFNFLLKTFLAIGITFLSNAYAASDLTVNHIGSSSLNRDKTAFSLGLEIKNIGNTSFTGFVRLKPFIIPEINVSQINGFKAIQFDSSVAFVNIEAGQSKVVTYYTSTLPAIPRAKYWIGSTVVPDTEIQENSVLNNVTNELLQLGTFSNSGPSPLDTEIDIYSDVKTQITPVNGRASHPWRLTWRGTRDGARMRVLFFIYNPKEKYIYTSTYEKSVGWVNMGRDYDERGRLNNYDVYNQGPEFNASSPGDIFLMTLSNYTENAFEFSHVNNLDGRKFHASYISGKKSLEIWKTYVEEDPNPFNETVQLNSLYSKPMNWELNRGDLPNEMISNVSSGITSPSYQMLFSNENWSLDYGVYKYSASIKIKKAANESEIIEEKPINFVISKFIGGAQPVLVADSAVRVTATSPFAPQPIIYTISNTGASPMQFKLESNNDWIFFSSNSGTVPAGGSVVVNINFSPIGLDIGNTVGRFVIHNNSVESHKVVEVTYTDNAPVYR